MTKNKSIKRPPVVAVLGHIDHGKSSLLDYIRQTNVIESEVGGITQHLSSYEVTHPGKTEDRKITFLDTPGHAAFSTVRAQGIKAADIAVLIVSAEDGVKPQTLEAYQKIQETGLTCLVAINKIDKPNADVNRTRQSLTENEIFLESHGGDLPAVEISAKNGDNIDELLDTILLLADLQELTGQPDQPASGIVLESEVDPKKGIRATLIIKNGTLKKNMAVTSGLALCPVRMLFDFKGEQLSEAAFSSPVDLVGWNEQPAVGTAFQSWASKKEAEQYLGKTKKPAGQSDRGPTDGQVGAIPVIIKADTAGCLSAITTELAKIEQAGSATIQVVDSGLGNITEGDIRNATITAGTVVIGFNINLDPVAERCRDQFQVPVKTFNLIYELTDWLSEYVETNRPRTRVEKTTGSLKVLKTFSRQKNKNVVGGRVENGELVINQQVKVIRKQVDLGQGRIKELQQQKTAVEKVTEGAECGLMVESPIEIAAGDTIETFTVVEE